MTPSREPFKFCHELGRAEIVLLNLAHFSIIQYIFTGLKNVRRRLNKTEPMHLYFNDQDHDHILKIIQEDQQNLQIVMLRQ